MDDLKNCQFEKFELAATELHYDLNPLFGVSFTFGISSTTSLLATASCFPCFGWFSFASSS